MRRLIPVAVLLAAVSACGGQSDKVSHDGPPSLSSLADSIGCTNLEPDPDLVGVREGGSCKLGASTVYVYTYATDKQRADMHDLTRLGGGVWVVGNAWEAQTPGQGVAEKVAEATGGEVE